MAIIKSSAAILAVALLAHAVSARSEQLVRIDTIESYTRSRHVFAGIAVSSGADKVRFRVEKIWKGDVSAEMDVALSRKRANPLEVVIDDAYIVYMTASEMTHLLPYESDSREQALLADLSNTRYRVLAAAGPGMEDALSSPRTDGPRPPPRSAEESTRKRERFQRAHALITERRFAQALPLLEANIEEWPEASDLDYEQAWAALCYARTGDLPKSLSAYKTMTTRFFGFVPYNPGLDWAFQLRAIRDAIADSKSERATATLHAMEDLHVAAIREFRLDLLRTVAAAERGDEVASARLAGPRFSPELPKLIAAGVLGLRGSAR